MQRMQAHAMRVVAEFGIGVGQEVGLARRGSAAASRAPASVDSNTPPLDMPMYMCSGSRGSTRIECSLGPSGVPSWSPPHHALRCGCSLKPSTPVHVAPPSSERNRPCGDVPAYQTPGSRRVARRRARTCDRRCARCRRLNAGGRAASFQVRPRSVERKTVGPRWPVRAAASSVLPSRGSSTA